MTGGVESLAMTDKHKEQAPEKDAHEPAFFEGAQQINGNKVKPPYVMIIILLVMIIVGFWNVYTVDHEAKQKRAEETARAIEVFRSTVGKR